MTTRRSLGVANQEISLWERDGNSTAELGCTLTAAFLHVLQNILDLTINLKEVTRIKKHFQV